MSDDGQANRNSDETPHPPIDPDKDTSGRRAVSEVLGTRYEVIEKLGAGAFGEVYRARDSVLHREVAVKRIRLDAFAEGDLLEEVKTRFLNEARVAAQLKHANIVTTHDIVASADSNSNFMVLELVSGETLQQRLKKRGSLGLDETIHCLSQVAEALDYAHSKRVYHRDIKPANIMIEPNGEVRVMDFGIAKMEGSGNITATGNIIGTPNYMSPEQARGEPVDGRADLFSLACVLYECLSGERPFRGKNITAVLMEILTREPEPIDLTSKKLPDHVDGVLRKALSKTPEARFQTGGELIAALKGEAVAFQAPPAGAVPSVPGTPSVPSGNVSTGDPLSAKNAPTVLSAAASPSSSDAVPSLAVTGGASPSNATAPPSFFSSIRAGWLAAFGLLVLVVAATQVLTDSASSSADEISMADGSSVPLDEATMSPLVSADEVGFMGKVFGKKPIVRLTVVAGQPLALELSTSLSSETASINDQFSARLAQAVQVEGFLALPVGTEIEGHVAHAKAAGKVQGVGELTLEFDRLRTPSGAEILIQAPPLVHKARTTRKRDAAKVGGAAGVGAVIGGLFGGKKGAAIGAGIGGGAGTGAVMSSKGEEVVLAEGTALRIEISEAIEVVSVGPTDPDEVSTQP